MSVFFLTGIHSDSKEREHYTMVRHRIGWERCFICVSHCGIILSLSTELADCTNRKWLDSENIYLRSKIICLFYFIIIIIILFLHYILVSLCYCKEDLSCTDKEMGDFPSVESSQKSFNLRIYSYCSLNICPATAALYGKLTLGKQILQVFISIFVIQYMAYFRFSLVAMKTW